MSRNGGDAIKACSESAAWNRAFHKREISTAASVATRHAALGTAAMRQSLKGSATSEWSGADWRQSETRKERRVSSGPARQKTVFSKARDTEIAVVHWRSPVVCPGAVPDISPFTAAAIKSF
ncbi:hypothetical protein [Pararhizobium sp. DWP3-4]|uniref:hypothetical protein n=1 Tax=unclassified Pararhizobium TaxID=2643050 RepID=UPI003CEA501A